MREANASHHVDLGPFPFCHHAGGQRINRKGLGAVEYSLGTDRRGIDLVCSAAKKCSGQTGRVVVPPKNEEDTGRVSAWYSPLLYDSFEEAKEKCCELCEFYRQPCTTFQVILLVEGDEEDYGDYSDAGKAQCLLYKGKPTIQECGASGCPVTDGGNAYLTSSTSRSDNYVGAVTGKEPKCGYAVFPDTDEYSFWGYRGHNGFAFQGYKSRGKIHKIAKNVRSIKICFQKCVNDDDSECESFTYDTKEKRCRMNKGGYVKIKGEEEEFLSKFCWSSDRYVSGFIVDEYD
eukprot:jgi/Picsp_1/6467/NSC_03813-R1_---NA---